MDTTDDFATTAPAFPMLNTVARHARMLSYGAGVGMLAISLWLGLRMGWIELYVLAPIAGALAYFSVRLAAEMVTLVAETLMPR
ncbi:MAG: hypothetical protein EOO27_14155 [Comamonadaceae bacterium]|nr:MAG: hypothetical protein EOO27_14155 [Comamonadaceae bacterium]